MGKIAVLFPGQASQYVGMGKTWYERHESVRERFSEASEILGFDLAELMFSGPAARLNQTENTQPALLVLSVAMFEAIRREDGIRPSYLAGHSIGELSALTAAGVIGFADAVRLARIRGEAMAACSEGSGGGMMAVTGITGAEVAAVLMGIDPDGVSVQVANYNSPKQTVLSGSAEGLKLAGERIAKLGADAKVIPLNVSGPFHSRFMAGAAEALEKALQPVQLGAMAVPVVSCLNGQPYVPDDDIKASLVAQVTQPVRWTSVLSTLMEAGVEQWLEVGPKDVLKKLTLHTFPGANAYAYDDEADRERQAQSKLNRPNLVGLCMGAAVCTRNSNFDEAAYERGVIKPYQELQALYESAEKEGRVPTQEEMGRALSLLRVIFETKGTPAEERVQRFKHILAATDTEELFPEYADLILEGA
ncbi:ACP S-malonyltransferase [Paenibacillus hamazuiensis]|uniref:ACP S-malonyltransferase n=1 Tax=Paenibacillus hamazuiensis TaxID=2936508 RepID=UPI00200DA037|nr:ACP S-malonyltransferase [Paenibacillus hamazuiensis]